MSRNAREVDALTEFADAVAKEIDGLKQENDRLRSLLLFAAETLDPEMSRDVIVRMRERLLKEVNP